MPMKAGDDMTSKRQIEANRKNAGQSTGPKTIAGKARSSHNALRHGLASQGHLESEDIARSLAGALGEVGKAIVDAAHCAARLKKVRAVRYAMLVDLLAEPRTGDISTIRNLDRYQRIAATGYHRAIASIRNSLSESRRSDS
jgi:hypothetical protein